MKTVKFWLITLLLFFGTISNIQGQNNLYPNPTEESFFLHTIERGQSLYSIATMYNVTQEEIIRLNPGCEEKIYAGKTLKIPQNNKQISNQFFHTIQPKETLYQLTKKYNVSAKEIVDANPGLSAENFKIGEVIVIPVSQEPIVDQTMVTDIPQTNVPAPNMDGQSTLCRDMHKVKKKETIFSISREYGISERELISANPELQNGVLKKGTFICIPYPSAPVLIKNEDTKTTATSIPDRPVNDRELINSARESSKKISTIKAAVILPFMLDSSSNKEDAGKMLEYYEGFLIAVDSLKKSGISMDLYTYDSGNAGKSIQPILTKNELKEMDIIFGPYFLEHVSPLAEFAKENNIHLVIPFQSKVNEVFNNSSIYLVNTTQSYIYSEVYDHFFRKFPKANIIFMQADDKNKDEFIQGFKQELNTKNIPYQTVRIDDSPAALKLVLDQTKDNIFIPTSGANSALTKSLPHLTVLVRENPEYAINLFGYPEWQTYTKDHLSTFYELDTYFYSSFYTNNLFPQAVDFSSTYWRWYGKDMVNSYPKYGMLGFDTGYFFLKGLAQYGTNFEDDINKINVSPIQTGFKFERASNWGGFINRKVFFVHFAKDYELIKLNFD